jgi:hypothetical protein
MYAVTNVIQFVSHSAKRIVEVMDSSSDGFLKRSIHPVMDSRGWECVNHFTLRKVLVAPRYHVHKASPYCVSPCFVCMDAECMRTSQLLIKVLTRSQWDMSCGDAAGITCEFDNVACCYSGLQSCTHSFIHTYTNDDHCIHASKYLLDMPYFAPISMFTHMHKCIRQ